MKDKKLLTIIGIIAIIILFGIAPIVEVTLKDKIGNTISYNKQKIFLGSQSLIPLEIPGEAESAEITILRPGRSFYYECEGEIPKTMTEIKELCIYIGTDEIRFP
jgi:hypothetical protein